MKNSSKVKKYEELGRVVTNVYETGYLDTGKSLRMSLIKGAVGGFGGVIGATIGIALLIWLLSLFGELPLVGRFFETARDTIKN